VGIGAGGAPGTAYHSNYDTTAWYRKSVGDDYASAVLVSKATIAVAATLAQAGGVPQSGAEVVRTIREACERMRTEAAAATDPLAAARSEAATRVIECFVGCDRADGVDRLLLAADGLPGRPWFRNLLIATNPDNSYQCGDLPGLRWARSKAELDLAVEQLCAAATRMGGNAPSQGGEPSNAQ
jgi:N-acetylated-alpha-linked acidic dipeptidase